MSDAPGDTPDLRYRRAARVATRVLPDRVVLARTDPEASVELRGTGLCLWLALDGEPMLDEVVADLADAFALEPSLVRADVVGGLDSLVAHGFVEIVV